jgi:ADP-dependent NAD(P)H-hydrate dehydratase / NAD(P)H-hydrate epimerase
MFVIKTNEMKKLEQFMIETVGLSSLILMENAAKTVVDVIVEHFSEVIKPQQSIVILCGAGNNGGDGLAISRWLIHKGYVIKTFLIGPKEKWSSETQQQFFILDQLVKYQSKSELIHMESLEHENEVERLNQSIRDASLIVDSLIGTGCQRILSNVMVHLVDQINQSSAKVISVDLPTGINSDNGKVMGIAVKATTTVTFCLPKLGHVLFPGMHYCGNLIVTDIGIFEQALMTLENPITLINEELFIQYKQQGIFHRESFSHKGTFGTLGIIAGEKHMLGATILAAKAAYKSGVGLVKLFAHEDYCEFLVSAINECVVVPFSEKINEEGSSADLLDSLEAFLSQVNTVLIGPGLSKSPRGKKFLEKVLSTSIRAIIDADALNIISEQMELLEMKQGEVIITPHIGEMSRLTGYPGSGIIENLLPFAEAFSDKFQVTTVLKSARTVIVTDRLKRYINLLGNSGMATAGSGDVLAGIIAGLAAQGYSNEDSAVIGTLLHSQAGDYYAKQYGEHSLTASELLQHLWKK